MEWGRGQSEESGEEEGGMGVVLQRSTHHEAMQVAVVRVEKKGGEGAGLSSSVPAIRAVHQHTGAIEQGLGGGGGGGGGEGQSEDGAQGRGGEGRGGERMHLCREKRGLHDELDVPEPAR